MATICYFYTGFVFSEAYTSKVKEAAMPNPLYICLILLFLCKKDVNKIAIVSETAEDNCH